jgi:hypothetical protein
MMRERGSGKHPVLVAFRYPHFTTICEVTIEFKNLAF